MESGLLWEIFILILSSYQLFFSYKLGDLGGWKEIQIEMKDQIKLRLKSVCEVYNYTNVGKKYYNATPYGDLTEAHDDCGWRIHLTKGLCMGSAYFATSH